MVVARRIASVPSPRTLDSRGTSGGERCCETEGRRCRRTRAVTVGGRVCGPAVKSGHPGTIEQTVPEHTQHTGRRRVHIRAQTAPGTIGRFREAAIF